MFNKIANKIDNILSEHASASIYISDDFNIQHK